MRVPDECACCTRPIYLNTGPERTISKWVHTATGSMHCLEVDDGLAAPTHYTMKGVAL